MAYVTLPRNITFSSPRRISDHTDAFNIVVDGNFFHVFEYDTDQIMGNSSEEFVIAQAHIDAKDWLRNNGHLPTEV